MVFILLAGLFVNEWIFAALFFLITILGLREFYNLITNDHVKPQTWFGVVAGGFFYLMITVSQYLSASLPGNLSVLLPVGMMIPLFFIPFVIELYRNTQSPLFNISLTILGIFYIALPLALLNVMNSDQTVHFLGFPAFLTGYFLLVWFNDTAAYLYGKQFGKHKLFERISPKKTWEGTLAGLTVAILTAVGFSFLIKDILILDWIVLAILVVFFGIMGDLAESMIKRSLNVKDSGTILPGHGGILDRFDAIFLSAPFVFLYFLFRFL